ncbi:molybdopterin-dependent oxidoreductase [Parasporobacterium paucivorans]|uniref:Trimethylamine-N-oxide reductase (Cytochrome c) n=1 Tax=Parasporobacterium paucivorans DSM 15970 TaxID=1122934 RepID=A0A1M6FDE7_9FIRM|nr:molybdopterin-dependent oxidoreductase [Parasporobacterium paucivorans]SHI95666.1 trimethylamine-N-oxide reductase (cytochrome c) [Parasporobacterium paucivorans DSM 15970]
MNEFKKLTRKTQMTTGGPVFVYVDEEQDKIVRMTPMDLDENDADSWKIEARGRTFQPPRKTTYTAFTAGFKGTIYTDRRIMYPMKRVDFDPNGERNEEKRGESGYERISWDEALDIVTGEIRRIKREFGPGAMVIEPSSHHLWGNIGYRHSALFRFMNTVGMTYADHNPDSWEGFHWGATHMWGFTARLGNPEQTDLFEDCIQNCEMMVFWSSDPETNNGIYSAYESTIRRRWLKELGVKMVFIDPYYNNTNLLYGGKWFSPQLGTDSALALGIAYTWLTEGTYDKEYVKTHTFGFDEWTEYVLGKTDGIPKTTEWAAEECNIPAHEIRALAREWAKNKTMLAAGGLGGWGGACRSPIGMDWARLMVALITMQGLGKPGINMYSTTQGVPVDSDFYFPGYADGGIAGDCDNSAAGATFVYRMFDGVKSRPMTSNLSTGSGVHLHRMRLPECVLDDEVEWYGRGFVGASQEQQFHKYTYPAAGYSRIQMLYKYGGPHIGTMGEGNRYARMYRTKRLPFVVSQSIWMEGEVPFADIILPACTNFERWDIGEWCSNSGYNPDSHNQCNHRVIMLQQKCINPVGESKSDYEIFRAICEKLNVGQVFSEGKTDLDWAKQMFYASDLPTVISWEEFFEKGYYIVPVTNKAPSAPAFRWFAEDREQDVRGWISRFRPGDLVDQKGLQTQSGKVEFVSNSLKRFGHYDTDDKERPLMPMYIPSWEGHHTDRIKTYPLAVVSPHPRFTFHTHSDGKNSYVNDIKDHRVLIDGFYYWIFRINSVDAEARGIKDGDIIKAYNERGSVLFAAKVTERIPAGTCHCYESSAEYVPLGEPGNSTDRGGCINILTPARLMSKYASGMATEHCLVEVEKWKGDN